MYIFYLCLFCIMICLFVSSFGAECDVVTDLNTKDADTDFTHDSDFDTSWNLIKQGAL